MPLAAGASETVITPPTGVPLLGTIQRSTGVHDDLYARALVLIAGATRIAIVSLDLIGLEFRLADDMRLAVQHRTGIAAVMLNCTHTHSAPFTVSWSSIGPRTFERESSAWRAELIENVSMLVHQAVERASPASLAVGRAPAQIGFNRRFPTAAGIFMKPNPQGTIVPWVDVLRVDGRKGKTIAILFSHAAHPVIIHGASRLISADYPGYAAKAVKSHFGADTVAIFVQAFGANINGDPLRGGFEAAERAGRALAEAANTAAERGERISDRGLEFKSVWATLPIRDYPPLADCQDALKRAEARLVESAGSVGISDDQLWNLQERMPPARPADPSSPEDTVQPVAEQPWWHADTVLCLRDLAEKAARRQKQALRFEVNRVSIGDEWCMLAATHELFAEYQHWIEQSAPYQHKMALAYTNGLEGYIPTDKDFGLGGYEAGSFPEDAAALRFPFRLALQPGVEQQVKDIISSVWMRRGPV